jgi:hypothetical protein
MRLNRQATFGVFVVYLPHLWSVIRTVGATSPAAAKFEDDTLLQTTRRHA